MTKKETINRLAHRLSNEVMTTAERNHIFTDLMEALQTDIFMIAKNFIVDKCISNYNISLDDYISNLSYEGITNALMGYDQNKGDFIARLKIVGKNWMSNQFRKDFSKKCMASSTKALSLDELMEEDGIQLTDETDDYTVGTTNLIGSLIGDFIKSDKDGQAIAILASIGSQKARNTALTNLFGQYTATERKRVQRARERLEKYLLSNGVQV